jgi:aspartate-semialdehyde dehydrogenase
LPNINNVYLRITVDVEHIRVDGHASSFLAAGDQLRIGAALNAVEIARRLPG